LFIIYIYINKPMPTERQPITNLLATNAQITGAIAIIGDVTIGASTAEAKPLLTYVTETVTNVVAGDTGLTGPTGDTGLTGPTGDTGLTGTDGQSAYEIAVAGGLPATITTEAEWIASLTGPPGTDSSGTIGTGDDGQSAYEIAVAGGLPSSITTEAEWIASLTGTNGTDGTDGDSAYDIAVAGGLDSSITTEAEWIASLSGAAGGGGLAIMFSPAGWNTFDYFPTTVVAPAAPVGDGLTWTVYIDVNATTRMYIWKPHTTLLQGPSPTWSGGGWHHISTVELIDPNTNQPTGSTTVLTAI
jgi:hypothetical protein